jgi:hypothetical protein
VLSASSVFSDLSTESPFNEALWNPDEAEYSMKFNPGALCRLSVERLHLGLKGWLEIRRTRL